jgi:hypothetical protein
MAAAKPANRQPKEADQQTSNGPEIEYFGEGAEDVKFDIDPKAVRIRVYAEGRILIDY